MRHKHNKTRTDVTGFTKDMNTNIGYCRVYTKRSFYELSNGTV
ncbi:hypothetical protein [Spirosoma flavus]